jgi:6-phosphogluconolactonase
MRAPLSTAVMIIGLVGYSASLEAQSRFVYTNNDILSTNTVSGFSVAANGAISEISGSPFQTGGGGTGGGGFAVNRVTAAAGKFLYASNDGTHNISAFVVDPVAGGLTQVPTSPYSAGVNSGWGDISLAASADGQFLFAAVASNLTVVTFGIGADGSLTQLSSVAIPASPAGIKASADGNYLVVGLPGYGIFGAVAMFSIGSSGALTMVNSVPFADSGPAGNLSGVDIDCAGGHVFGSDTIAGPATVDVFSIGSGGLLSAIQGSPFSAGVGANSNVAVLSSNDQFLFVSDQGSASVTVFGVSSGTLSVVAGSPFAATGGIPAGMATDQGGAFLYVAGSPNLIHVFSIAANGALSEVPGSPFNTNQSSGQLLSLAAFPAKTCAAGPVGGPPPVTPPPPPVTPGPTTVKIKIMPGEDNDSDKDDRINPKSHGKIRVAVLSSSTFNAPAQVDMTSLTFGHTGNEPSLASCNTHREDVNHDHMPDLVCHFEIKKANFQKGDTIGILKGTLLDKTPIQGTAPVHIAH